MIIVLSEQRGSGACGERVGGRSGRGLELGDRICTVRDVLLNYVTVM